MNLTSTNEFKLGGRVDPKKEMGVGEETNDWIVRLFVFKFQK